MEIQGKLIEIFETQQVSDRFRKREFVLEYATNPEYPEFLKFELVQDRCEQLDGFQVNETLQVRFDLKGRRWTDRQGQVKYFNSLQAWQLSRLQADAQPSSEPPSVPQDMPLPEPPPPGDDLPF